MPTYKNREKKINAEKVALRDDLTIDTQFALVTR
jgi:hypothetical protein